MKVPKEQAERAREWASRFLTELELEAATLYEQIQQSQRQYNAMRKQIQGLKWFIDPENDDELIVGEPSVPVTINEQSDAQFVKNTVCEILRGVYPNSLHYNEILARLKDFGVGIPGKDPRQNLLSYLSRDTRFVRVDRGEYKLAEDEQTATA